MGKGKDKFSDSSTYVVTQYINLPPNQSTTDG